MKNFLRKRRNELGLTQLQVARLVELAESAYQRYELSYSEPRVTLAIRLARALNTTVEELFIVEEDL